MDMKFYGMFILCGLLLGSVAHSMGRGAQSAAPAVQTGSDEPVIRATNVFYDITPEMLREALQ